jgi:hypothetical protein
VSPRPAAAQPATASCAVNLDARLCELSCYVGTAQKTCKADASTAIAASEVDVDMHLYRNALLQTML